MRKDVDAGAEQLFGIRQTRCMHGDAHVVFMGLIDDRAIQVGCQFLHASAAVVHPGLDDFDLLRRQLTHARSRSFFSRDDVGRVPHVGRRDLVNRR